MYCVKECHIFVTNLITLEKVFHFEQYYCEHSGRQNIKDLQYQVKSSYIITKTCPCNKQGKFEKIHKKKLDIFLIFAQNIDCGYKLEPPWRGGSNEYPQSIFWSKNKKNRYTPAYPSFII